VGSPIGGAGPPLVAPPCGEATLAHYCHRPFAYFIVPKNLSRGGLRDRHRRLCGAENTRERKALRQAEICRGNCRGNLETVAMGMAYRRGSTVYDDGSGSGLCQQRHLGLPRFRALHAKGNTPISCLVLYYLDSGYNAPRAIRSRGGRRRRSGSP
jgi:hypothetical protein